MDNKGLINGFRIFILPGILLLMEMGTSWAQLPAANFNHLRRDFELFSSGYGALTEDNRGFVWFGSRNGGGLYRYDGYTLTPFIFDPSRKKESISTSLIHCAYPVHDTLMYVGTYFGYSTINPVTGSIRSYNNVLEEIEDSRLGNTLTFFQDSLHHTMWVGTMFGLAAIEHASGRFELKRPSPLPNGADIPTMVRQILRDPANADKLYLIGHDGFFQYDIPLGSYSRIRCPLKAYALEKNMYHMLVDPEGNIWIGVASGAVLQYKPSDQTWKAFSIPVLQTTPFGHNAVYNLIWADKSRLWLGMNTGVGILHTDTGEFEGWTYQPENPNGLLPQYEYANLMSDRYGRLWIGSRYGIQYSRNAILPSSGQTRQPPVAITRLDIKPLLEESEKPLLYSGAVALDRQQRDISLHYVLPNPLDPKEVVYEYMLDGYDKDWITTDQRTVRYGQLSGGEYVFRIRAKEGKNGAWTDETTIQISIPRRITEMLWFWIIIGLCIIGFAFAANRYMVTQARKKAKLKADFEHQLSEIQMQALRAQMNPHFLFNSLNSIKYFAISKSKDETAAYLSKFALLVRTILTNSKSRTISLQDELDALRLYIEIEHLRLEGKFDYSIDIDSSIHIRQAQIPPMILQPFVENAIWHGLMHKDGKGMLRVHVQDMGRQIQCVIEDNGIGRARSAELRKSQMEHRKSEGMQITADRIALINRIYQIHTEVDVVDLKNGDGTAAGTRVVVHIPLIHEEG